MRKALEKLEVEASPGDGSRRRDGTGWHGERRQSATDRFDRRPRYLHALERARPPCAASCGCEIAGDDERLECFLNEERIAFREPVKQPDEIVAEIFARPEDR